MLLGVSLSGSLKLLVDPGKSHVFRAKRRCRRSARDLGRGRRLAIILFCLFPVGIYAHLILTDVSDTDLIVPTLVSDPAVFPSGLQIF